MCMCLRRGGGGRECLTTRASYISKMIRYRSKKYDVSFSLRADTRAQSFLLTFTPYSISLFCLFAFSRYFVRCFCCFPKNKERNTCFHIQKNTHTLHVHSYDGFIFTVLFFRHFHCGGWWQCGAIKKNILPNGMRKHKV